VSLGAAGQPARIFLYNGESLFFFNVLWQNNPMSRWLKFVLVILVGLVLGLVYGWVISPVEYLDTTPSTLRYDYRTDYVLMVAEIFNSSRDADQAVRQLALISSDPPVEIAIQSLAYGSQIGYASEDLVLLQNLATSLQTWQPNLGEFNP
jgi:hypothetical protein